jgi:hypothetical protein
MTKRSNTINSHYSDEEIYANRVKVVEFLKSDKVKKAYGSLGYDGPDGRTCCAIGAMCEALDVSKEYGEWLSDDKKIRSVMYGVSRETGKAPSELAFALGMTDMLGAINVNQVENAAVWFSQFIDRTPTSGLSLFGDSLRTAITELNDKTDLTLPEIGEILDHMVCGGPGTPWEALPEANDED